MIKVEGTYTELKEVIINIDDKELIKAIRNRTQLSNFTLNDEEDEIGYWEDESDDRSNFSSWVWHFVSNDMDKIKLLKSIKNIEEYLRKNQKKSI